MKSTRTDYKSIKMPYTVSGDGAVGYWQCSDGNFIAAPSITGEVLTFTSEIKDAAIIGFQLYKIYKHNPTYLTCVTKTGWILSLQYDKKLEQFVWLSGHLGLDKHTLKTKTGECTVLSQGMGLSGRLV